MKISVHDLAHSKGMPAAATEAMLAMQDRIEALTAENERLREALGRSREGWENAIEFGLIPERHRNTAQILADEARAALAGKAEQ